jgi:hypothetical protein
LKCPISQHLLFFSRAKPQSTQRKIKDRERQKKQLSYLLLLSNPFFSSSRLCAKKMSPGSFIKISTLPVPDIHKRKSYHCRQSKERKQNYSLEKSPFVTEMHEKCKDNQGLYRRDNKTDKDAETRKIHFSNSDGESGQEQKAHPYICICFVFCYMSSRICHINNTGNGR